MMNISNNIQVQINNEINELNRKNRERMLLIYFNIFRTLYHEIKGLGSDIKSLRGIFDQLQTDSKSKVQGESIEQKLEIMLRDLENIDRILGLSITHKYYLVKKK